MFGWVMGHAAQTDRVFAQSTPRMFARGAFRDEIPGRAVDADHR